METLVFYLKNNGLTFHKDENVYYLTDGSDMKFPYGLKIILTFGF